MLQNKLGGKNVVWLCCRHEVICCRYQSIFEHFPCSTVKWIWPKQTVTCLTFHLTHLNSFGVYKKCRGSLGWVVSLTSRLFRYSHIPMHALAHAQIRTHAVHVSTHKFAHIHTHIQTVFAYLSLLCFYLFLYASLYLVFISLHLQETAYEILITMHYQDYVLSLLTSPVCVHMCLSWGLCSAC